MPKSRQKYLKRGVSRFPSHISLIPSFLCFLFPILRLLVDQLCFLVLVYWEEFSIRCINKRAEIPLLCPALLQIFLQTRSHRQVRSKNEDEDLLVNLRLLTRTCGVRIQDTKSRDLSQTTRSESSSLQRSSKD
jgi:hypothetical protein